MSRELLKRLVDIYHRDASISALADLVSDVKQELSKETDQQVMTGLRHELKNGASIDVYEMEDKTLYFEFHYNGVDTCIGLSTEAVSAMYRLMIKLRNEGFVA
jgi:hypothetical protein